MKSILTKLGVAAVTVAVGAVLTTIALRLGRKTVESDNAKKNEEKLGKKKNPYAEADCMARAPMPSDMEIGDCCPDCCAERASL